MQSKPPKVWRWACLGYFHVSHGAHRLPKGYKVGSCPVVLGRWTRRSWMIPLILCTLYMPAYLESITLDFPLFFLLSCPSSAASDHSPVSLRWLTVLPDHSFLSIVVHGTDNPVQRIGGCLSLICLLLLPPMHEKGGWVTLRLLNSRQPMPSSS